MSTATSELIRFVTLFVVIGVQVTINLQHMNGGLTQTENDKDTGDQDYSLLNDTSHVKIGFWGYCIEDQNGVTLVNQNVNFSAIFKHEVCIQSAKDFTNSTGNSVIPEADLIITARWLVICSLPLFLTLLLLHVAIGNPSLCIFRVMMAIVVIGFVVQAVVMALLIVVWKKSDDIFSLGWPWIMSIVSLCVIGVLLGLHSLMLCFARDWNQRQSNETDHNGKFDDSPSCAKACRWIFIVLFLPAIVLQFFIHVDRGATTGKVGVQEYMGLWWYCLQNITYVHIGARNPNNPVGETLTKPNLCLQLTQSTDPLVDYTYVTIGKICAIMTHFCTLAGFFFAVYARHTKPRHQKGHFYARFVLMFFALVFATITGAMSATIVPLGFHLDYGFICFWVAFCAIAVVFCMCLVQTFINMDLFGEIQS